MDTWAYSPAVTSRNGDRLDVFAVGTDNAVYRKVCKSSVWGEWENLGGASLSAPAAVSSAQSRIDIFAVGADSALYHKWLS